ncbi:MAG TPA: DUF6702 family protein [Chitinophagaceae bacterium]
MKKNILPMATWFNKWLFISVAPVFLYMSGHEMSKDCNGLFHPFHVSVTEINHNATEKTLEISCKLFTDDFENAINKQSSTKIDLIKPADKAAVDKAVQAYVLKNLSLKVNGSNVQFTWLGFENEGEATWCYFQVDNIASVRKVSITNTLMYDQFTDQTSIMHVIVKGERKSSKLDYPAKEAVFSF